MISRACPRPGPHRAAPARWPGGKSVVRLSGSLARRPRSRLPLSPWSSCTIIMRTIGTGPSGRCTRMAVCLAELTRPR